MDILECYATVFFPCKYLQSGFHLCLQILQQWEEPDNVFWFSPLWLIHFPILGWEILQNRSKTELWSQILLCCRQKKNYAFLCLKRSKFSLCVFHSHSVCLHYTISFSWPDSFYYCLFFLSVVATNMSSGVQICLKMRGNLAERLRVKCSRIHSAFVTLFSTSADTQRSESLGLTTHLAL